MRKWLLAAMILAVLGAADASYGIVQHYGPSGTGVCNWGGRISCDIVNKSVFSEIAGIPVAVLGLGGYIAMFLAALWCYKKASRQAANALFALTAVGFLISAYLTWVEIYLLRAICPICIVSQTVILLLLISSAVVWRQARRDVVSSDASVTPLH